jgi:hypothetical protein
MTAVERLDGLNIKKEPVRDDAVQGGKGPVIILKAEKSIEMYLETVFYYCIRTALKNRFFQDLFSAEGKCTDTWVNAGGRILSLLYLESRIQEAAAGKDVSWIPEEKEYQSSLRIFVCGAFSWWKDRSGNGNITGEQVIEQFRLVLSRLPERVRECRMKDFRDPLRQYFYATEQERTAVLGSPEEDSLFQDIEMEQKKLMELLGSRE